MKWIAYRALMRLAHRYGWHYAPRNPALTNEAGWALHRCSWCGLAGHVATAADLSRGPLLRDDGEDQKQTSAA